MMAWRYAEKPAVAMVFLNTLVLYHLLTNMQQILHIKVKIQFYIYRLPKTSLKTIEDLLKM